MDLELRGRRALVAAASSGLGLATAKALVAEGARTVICGRREDRVAEAVAILGDDARGLVVDVGDPEEATRFVVQGADALGGIDILVTNAGGPPPGTFATTRLATYESAVRLNLLSVIAMCQAAVPAMRAQRWGRIVAITSVTVRQPIANLIASTTARAGATGFLKTLATEVAGDGITVNSLQPGYHATARVQQVIGNDIDRIARDTPAGVLGDPEHFGRIAAFLCSPHAAFLTGAAIPVDGGAAGALQ